MGPPAPNYIVPSPAPASSPPRQPGFRMLPLTSPLNAPPPYSPPENGDDLSGFRTRTATLTTSSSATTTSTSRPAALTDTTHHLRAEGLAQLSPRQTVLGTAVNAVRSPSQERVNASMSSLLSSLTDLDLEAVLNADPLSGVDDVLMAYSGASSSSKLPSANGMVSSSAAATPHSPSSAPAARDRVGNYRKGSSVPASPRTVSREHSGENLAGTTGTSSGRFGILKPTGADRTSASVSRESSGSDFEDSLGATGDENRAMQQTQRLRSTSQSNLTPQSPPRKLPTHKRTNTADTSTPPSSSPEKGSPNKTPENG
jgi:hypothetical protein